MAVDLQARADLASTSIHFMRGEIRSFALDDRITAHLGEGRTGDQSVTELARVLSRYYSDDVDHSISVTQAEWESLKRIVLFLTTDLEIQYDNSRPRPSELWPFGDASELFAHAKAQSDTNIPVFDPRIHSVPIVPWWDRIPTCYGICIIVAAAAVLCTVLTLLYSTR